MAFNRDSSLDISLARGLWLGGASDGTTIWFVGSTRPGEFPLPTSPQRGRVIQQRISRLARELEWRRVSDGTTHMVRGYHGSDSSALLTWPPPRARDDRSRISVSSLLVTAWEAGPAGHSNGTTIWFQADTVSDRSKSLYRGRDEGARCG